MESISKTGEIQMETKTIFTRKMAYELRRNGFKIIRTEPDKKHPEFDNYIFEDSEDLQKAMATISNKQYQKR